MKILMACSEASPWVKTGGLADVLGSLPPALAALGLQVGVVLPRYRGVALDGARGVYAGLTVWIGLRPFSVDIYAVDRAGVTAFLVDCPPLFDRDGIYGHLDDHIRFGALSKAALGIARRLFRPKILHCHDWQTALVPGYLRHHFAGDPTFAGMKVLFTIHNLGYRGEFSPADLAELGLADLFQRDALEFYGNACLMKAGLLYSDWLSTVSPRYAAEIQTSEFGFGLDGVLRGRTTNLTGILNGADYDHWDPATDPHIAANFSADDPAGKAHCKRDLIERMGLDSVAMDRPLIGIVSRFAHQKGFDLIAEMAWALMNEHVSLAVLGSGDLPYENLFRALQATYPGRVGLFVGYSEDLAHRVYAGSDLFLMPSRYEPCGLSQIYSLRYGTLPVVRATGGLDDTIEEDSGFKFHGYSPWALLDAIRAATGAWWDRERRQRMIRAAMTKDFSWSASAGHYVDLYRQLAG